MRLRPDTSQRVKFDSIGERGLPVRSSEQLAGSTGKLRGVASGELRSPFDRLRFTRENAQSHEDA